MVNIGCSSNIYQCNETLTSILVRPYVWKRGEDSRITVQTPQDLDIHFDYQSEGHVLCNKACLEPFTGMTNFGK